MASITEFSRLSAILTMDITGFLKNTEIANQKLVAFGQKASKIGATISRGLGLAFGLVGGAAVSTASEFNKVSVQLRSLVGTGSFKELSDQSRLLGESTIFTRIQIVEAQKELAKLGTAGGDIKKIVPPIAALAGALDEDLVGAASGVKEALNIYTLNADQAGRVTDLYAQAVKSSALTIPQLREGLKNIGPILAQQNYSIEDTVALLALLSNSAIKGSTAGTKLRSTFNRLASQGFDDANQSIAKLTEGTFSYSEILELLNSRAAVVGAIVTDQADSLKDLQVKMETATGTSEGLAEAFEGELFFTVEQLKNAIQNLGIEIGTGLVPVVEGLRNVAVDLARFFSSLDDSSKKVIGTFVAMIPVVGGLVFVIGQLVTLMGLLATTTGAIVAIGSAVAIAFGGIALAAASSKSEIDDFRDTLQETQNVAETTFKSDEASEGLRKTSSAFIQGTVNADKLAQKIAQLSGEINTLSAGGGTESFAAVKFESGGALQNLLDQRAAYQDLYDAQVETNEANQAEVTSLEKVVEARKTLNQIFADGLALRQREEESIKANEERNKTLTKVLQQANRQLDKARIDTLPDYQQKVAEINRKFAELRQKLLDAGASTSELERIRKELVRLAEADVVSDRESFLENLRDQLATSGGSEIENSLASIAIGMRDLRREAEDLGLAGPELERLLSLLETRQSAALFEEETDRQRKEEQDALKAYSNFFLSDLELQIQAKKDAVKDILSAANFSAQQEREIYEKLTDDIRKMREDAAKDVEETQTDLLRPVQQFANQIGNAFARAMRQGTSFFEALKDSFLNFFQAIIGKLVALITLYGILALLSGGATAAPASGIGQAASGILNGQNLGQFIGSGLGFRSAQGGGGMSGFGSRIDGGDIVVSNQVSGRQMTRIGG